MAKKTDLRALSLPELEKEVRDARAELLQMRLRKKTGQIEKPHLFQQLRRRIARLETVAHEKRAAGAAA